MNRIALVPAGLCVAALLFASGDFNIGPFFTPLSSPENVDAFRHGHPGLITPALNKADEFIVFRYLSGLTLDGTDALNPVPGPGDTTGGYSDSHGAGLPAWNAARASVFSASNPILAPLAPIPFDTYQMRRSPSNYVFYENCLRDAFETAARTLKDRQQRYASQSVFRDWIHAQDQVFANCNTGKPVYPAEPASDLPQLERADRMYQIAAAHFYAEDLETARKLFSAISEDRNSPWQKIGVYMVARTLLREVSLQKNGASESDAAEAFQKIVDDPAAGSLRDSARGLLRRANTTETLQSLSRQIMLPRPTVSLSETLRDSRYVMLTESFQKTFSRPDLPEPFDWVQTLESGAASHAVDRWRAAKSLPWLTLALMYSSGNDAVSAELIKEADRLDKASPAFETAAYNAIRLRIERGERAGPRARLDSLLANGTNQPKSVLNAWRAERMRLATSFDDFLRWAPRTPIYEYRDANSGSPVLANDSAWVLNYRTPVSKLAEAAHNAHLPGWSAADVALAAWTRAYMLGDRAGLRDMAPIVAKSHPGWAAALTPPSTPEFELWKFHAAVLIAHNAAFQPLIPVDYRNHVQSNSWWCALPLPPNSNRQNIGEPDAAWRLPAFYEPADSVIAKSDRSLAGQEIARLRQVGSAQALIAPIILEWAKSHPQDPAIPEALHRIVMVVRYGCRDDPANGELSKPAFDLLHSRYSKSEWAAKTPYWFK